MSRKKVKCSGCKGIGYRSAAREVGMQDAPLWAKPVGVWPCSDCNGSGEVADIEAWTNEWWNSMTPAEQDELRDKIRVQLDKLSTASLPG